MSLTSSRCCSQQVHATTLSQIDSTAAAVQPKLELVDEFPGPWGYQGSILLIGRSDLESEAGSTADRGSDSAATGDAKAEQTSVVEAARNGFLKRLPKDHPGVVVLHSHSLDATKIELLSRQWSDIQAVKLLALPTADRWQEAEFREALSSAGGVWLTDCSIDELRRLNQSAELRRELHALLERGGAFAACGQSTCLLGRASHVSGASTNTAEAAIVGFNFIPGAFMMHSKTAIASSDDLKTAIQASPGNVGIALGPQTMLTLRQRTLRVVGEHSVNLILGPADYRPVEILRLSPGEIADWTTLRRAAQVRRSNVDPGVTKSKPTLQSGSLVIVGGGSMPRSIVKKFVELAGGSDAKIVYLPTAGPPSDSKETTPPAFFTSAGVASVKVLNQRGPVQVNSEEFREALREATAVWFGGGRQWNFVDAYEDTEAIELFHDVLRRGGVIGGSSAGATIQGEFLVRGHPLGNTVMMAEGYERGFSFLPGSAIDQHFAQRNRFADLEAVIKKHTSLLGVGVDEGTALIVQPQHAEVLGLGSVYLLNTKQLESVSLESNSKSRFVEVPSGWRVNLESLEVTQ